MIKRSHGAERRSRMTGRGLLAHWMADGHCTRRQLQPCFANGERLTLASEEQRRELFQLRRRENAEATFTYPSITYTISESDLSAPGSCGG